MDITQIIDAVVKCTGVSKEQLLSSGRKRKNVFARYLCMFFIKKTTDETLSSIGQILHPRKPLDHTTVIHGIRVVNNMIDIKDERSLSTLYLIEKELRLSLNEDLVKDRIYSIVNILKTIPYYHIDPCNTFGELAEQLNKRISA